MIIQELAQLKYRGKEPDIGFVDDLLQFCASGNLIEADTPTNDHEIVLRINGTEEVVLDVELAAHWKFRVICARLAKLAGDVNSERDAFRADAKLKVGTTFVEIKAFNGPGQRFFSMKPK